MLEAAPEIAEIVSRYVALRKSGREFIGLCPFHAEKTPSFSVNNDKGVYYCHSCNFGGDAIDFIMRIENLNFKATLAHLGMSQEKISSQEVTRRMTIKAARDALAAWANENSIALSAKMREIGHRGAIAGKILRELPGADRELLRAEIEDCAEQWEILETLQDDLFNPDLTLELWKQREFLERLVK